MTTVEEPGAGAQLGDEEKAAGWTFAAVGLLLFGLGGALVAALAVGAEQAFAKAGWNRPSWSGARSGPEPERVAASRAQRLREAQQWRAWDAERKTARRQAWKEHRRRMREYTAAGRQGPAPVRPARMGFAEWVGHAGQKSKSWYTLLDDKLTRNDTIPTGARKAWQFLSGFGEGVSRGWHAARAAQADGTAEGWESRKVRPAYDFDGEVVENPGIVENPAPTNETKESDLMTTDTDNPAVTPAPTPQSAAPAGPALPMSVEPTGQRAAGDLTADGPGPVAIGAGPVGSTGAVIAAGAGQGESHATLIIADLDEMVRELTNTDEVADFLVKVSREMAALSARMQDRAEAKTGTARLRQALEAAAVVCRTIDDRAAGVLQQNAETAEKVADARAGMAPAVDAEDAERAEGGSGDMSEQGDD